MRDTVVPPAIPNPVERGVTGLHRVSKWEGLKTNQNLDVWEKSPLAKHFNMNVSLCLLSLAT